MRKQELRREKILEEIIRNPGVMIRDLAAKLEVSRETIRRDFDALCDSGQLQRRYGGATVVPAGNILSFEARQDKHIGERTLMPPCFSMIARGAPRKVCASAPSMLR